MAIDILSFGNYGCWYCIEFQADPVGKSFKSGKKERSCMSKKTIRIFLFTALIVFSTFTLIYAGGVEPESPPEPGSLKAAALAVCNPYVSTTLLIIGMLGLLVELITFCSLAGGIGIIAMSVFFSAHIIVNPAIWWVAIIFGVGIIFLVAEIFFIPGHGISGIIGLVASFTAIIVAMATRNPVVAGYSILTSLVVSGGIFAVLLKYLPMLKLSAF